PQQPAGYPAAPHTPPGGAPAVGYPPPPPERGEVGSKTVQTVLLSLGGLLVAAALIIFTAVAWRNMGNGGRAAVLSLVTLLLLAIPFPFKRFKLWATAETFAALGAIALWCTTLAGYYLYRPPGTEFGPDSVGAWTAGVLAVLAAYRGAARLTATSWALLPLAAIGAGYSAASDLGLAVVLLLAIALALAIGAWLTARYPGRYERSDLWASRFLTCAAVVAACSAGLRAAFGLDDPVVQPVAAAVALVAAANLVGVGFAKRLRVSLTSMLIVASAAGSLVLCAWTLAVRSGSAELIVPSVALFAAAVTLFAAMATRVDTWGFANALGAGLASLAVFATVAFDAPDLSAYFVAFLAARLVAPLIGDPLGGPLRIASYLIAGGTAVAASLFTLGGITVLFGASPAGAFTWEIPIVLVALAFAAVLLPVRFRVQGAALATTFAVVSASVLLWYSDPDRWDAIPFTGFVLCAVIGLVTALASRTLAGRCAGWVSLAVWAPIAALAASNSSTVDPGSGWIPFWLTVAAAAMLVVAAGAPRRSRPDRVLASVLAHIVAGIAVVSGIYTWIEAVWDGTDGRFFMPAQFGIYTLALAGTAIMVPVRKWGYINAALATGTAGWWLLLAAQEVDTVEFFTAPPAAVLFLIGLWRLERRPQSGSWSTLALPIVIGMGPSLLLALGDGEPARRVGVGAAAIAVIIAGLGRRWQAPLVLGSVALLVLTINELTLVWDYIPVWIPPAIGGAVLIGAGATFEKRRRDIARIRDGLKAMR
ncbi:SCO7613 C-terminal domain-containing membrane protein, partial [Glycomyces dulcitolivorans]|uniref:SCO7613 C-terminal domain-containing membrane protein n=1 Tax=Glycomyces dulcitolivorans TaxID=2200759 RepID=UPI001300405D